MYSDEESVDDHEVVEEDDDDDLNYSEPDYFDYLDEEFDQHADIAGINIATDVLPLQDICLKSISQNLQKFNIAFLTTKDSYFKRNLQFLQKFHSPYLIKAAIKGHKKLNESYFNFLLNEHIKEFHLDILYECDLDTVFKRLSEIGHGFQKVSCYFPEVTRFERIINFVNKIMPCLPNVKILDLNSYCDDSTLEIIASSCLQLEELYIDDGSVTNKGLKSLYQENGDNGSRLNLKHISLSSVVDPDDGIVYLLQNMPSLEVITHPDLPYILYKMHKDSMNNTLERKYNLTSLYLGANSPWEDTPTISDILKLFSDVCPHIKNLALPLTSKEHLDLCFKFPELENFCVNNINDNLDLNLNEFLIAKGGIFRKLQLEKFSLSVDVLVQNCPKLESLNLQDITFLSSEPGATNLLPLNRLQELTFGNFSLSNAPVWKSVIDILNLSQKIEKLILLCVKFESNEEFNTKLFKFFENQSLKHLKFTSCDIDDVFLQSIVLTCSNLKTLEVEYCDNIYAFHINNLLEMSKSLRTQLKIIWINDKSELNSIDSIDDDLYDDYTDFSDYSYHDPYDSDNLYFGYDEVDDY